MSVFNLAILRASLGSRIQPGNPAVSEFLNASAALVRMNPCCSSLSPLVTELQELQDGGSLDDAGKAALARRLLEDPSTFERVAPAAAAVVLHEEGRGSFERLFSDFSVPGLNRDHVLEALNRPDSKTGRPPDPLDILAAVDRQGRDWQRLVEVGETIPMTDGALATGGDFDSAMMLLAQGGYAHQVSHRRGGEGFTSPLFVTLMTRPGSDVDAIRYTGGVHKRKLPLGEMPCGTAAFPIEVCGTRDVRGLFELLFWTPTGARIEEGFDVEMARQLARGAFVVYDPKTFSDGGRDMDERSAGVLAEAGRTDVTTAFIAGYSGAGDVFRSRLVPQEEERMGGFCLGAGVTDLERGRQWAAVMTATRYEDGEQRVVKGIKGAKVWIYRNLSLGRPLIIWVYSDPDLRKTQRLFAIYKNIYSGIIGHELFHRVWHALLKTTDWEVRAEDIAAVESDYKALVRVCQDELVRLLVDVEGIPRERAVILEPSRQDAVMSWGVKEGGIGRLFHLVRALFFDPYSNGGMSKEALAAAVGRWRTELDQVFSTRNPRAGAALAAGCEALRYGLVASQFDLMTPGVTFEGLNTALKLDQRLSAEQAEQRERLPQRVKDYVTNARAVRNPQALPPQVRNGLANLAALLAKMASGQPPSPNEVKALLHRPVRRSEVEDTMRWRNIDVETVLSVVMALKHHLEVAIRMITAYGNHQAQLAAPLLGHLRAMIQNMNLLSMLIDERNQRKEMPPGELLGVLHAIKSLLTEGDRLYLADEAMDGVMKDLKGRMEMLLAYLLGIHQFPYPRGQRVFLNRGQKGELREALAARLVAARLAPPEAANG